MSNEELMEKLAELEQRIFALEHPHYCRECHRDFSSGEAAYQHERNKH